MYFFLNDFLLPRRHRLHSNVINNNMAAILRQTVAPGGVYDLPKVSYSDSTKLLIKGNLYIITFRVWMYLHEKTVEFSFFAI